MDKTVKLRTLSLLKYLLNGNVLTIDGIKCTIDGDGNTVMVCERIVDGARQQEDALLPIDLTISDLIEAASSITEEDVVAIVGSNAITETK